MYFIYALSLSKTLAELYSVNKSFADPRTVFDSPQDTLRILKPRKEHFVYEYT